MMLKTLSGFFRWACLGKQIVPDLQVSRSQLSNFASLCPWFAVFAREVRLRGGIDRFKTVDPSSGWNCNACTLNSFPYYERDDLKIGLSSEPCPRSSQSHAQSALTSPHHPTTWSRSPNVAIFHHQTAVLETAQSLESQDLFRCTWNPQQRPRHYLQRIACFKAMICQRHMHGATIRIGKTTSFSSRIPSVTIREQLPLYIQRWLNASGYRIVFDAPQLCEILVLYEYNTLDVQ